MRFNPCRFVAARQPAPSADGEHACHARRTTRKGRSVLCRTKLAIAAGTVLFGGGLALLAAHAVKGQDRGAPTLQQELAEAQALLGQGKAREALKVLKRANSRQHKTCAECFAGMARAYYSLGEYEKAVEYCDRTLKYGANDRSLSGAARNLKGTILSALAQPTDTKKLQASEAEFRQALELTGQSPVVRFNLGVVLMKQGRDAEGTKELEIVLSQVKEAEVADAARRYLANPRRARENYAPPFSLTSISGERLSLDGLQGKVILLDFWATWCGPCRESVPFLARLVKKFAGAPVVVISVSADDDEDKWRRFIEKDHMVWPQYLDSDKKLRLGFKVDSFPAYILIDAEGIIRLRHLGYSNATGIKLESEINKCLKRLPRKDG